jgi:hypothetical protein
LEEGELGEAELTFDVTPETPAVKKVLHIENNNLVQKKVMSKQLGNESQVT